MNPRDPGSYDAIEPLIESVDRDGIWVRCTFRCPVTSVRVEAQARIESGGLRRTDTDAGVKRGLAGTLRSALGGDRQGDKERSKRLLSQETMRRAMQRAFRSVQTRFVWEAAGRWISAEAAGYVLPELVQLLKTAPVRHDTDRRVLVRMLAELSTLTGQLEQEARHFLDSFLSDEQIAAALGQVVSSEEGVLDLASLPPLTAAELEACTPGLVRDTMLMLGWGVTLVGRRVSERQQLRLDALAGGLGIEPPRAIELKRHAQIFLVDQALERAYASEERGASLYLSAMRLAADLGLETAEVERVDARLRKRIDTD